MDEKKFNVETIIVFFADGWARLPAVAMTATMRVCTLFFSVFLVVCGIFALLLLKKSKSVQEAQRHGLVRLTIVFSILCFSISLKLAFYFMSTNLGHGGRYYIPPWLEAFIFYGVNQILEVCVCFLHGVK